VLFGTCGGGITALRVAQQLERVSGVIAVGVPLKRSGARIPPGYARRTERRRALRQLAELRHRTGSGRVRRVIRPLVWSLVPRFSRRLPDDADRWLNTPLLGSMRALYARRLPVSLLYGENDIVRDEIEELFLDLNRLGERPWFELGLIPAVGHQLDDPDEVDAVAERIRTFAEQLRAPAARSAGATSTVLRTAGDPAVS
jgi:pimeloyl-ACP methyl ester carboxylesterase